MSSQDYQWLKLSREPEYRTKVQRALDTRERERRFARNSSVRQGEGFATRIVEAATSSGIDKEQLVHYSVAIGKHPENAIYNRYNGVEPYDRTRVIVGCGEGCEPQGRYLNASWVRERHGGKWWIAQQAPLPETVHAFLSIIFQPISHPPAELHPRPSDVPKSDTSRVRTVVQLTQAMEQGMRKAHIYFPPTVGDSFVSHPEDGFVAPNYKVILSSQQEIKEAHCVRSTVTVQPISADGKNAGDPVVFTHLLFSDWPDHGVPDEEYRAGLLKFIRLVDDVNRDITTQPPQSRKGLDPDPPIIINCSAGIGRTGSFIALSSLLRKGGYLSSVASTLHGLSTVLPELAPSPLGPLPDDIKDDLVAQEVDALREQRPGMVQRPEQMHLVYETLVMAFGGSEQKDAKPEVKNPK